MHEISLANPPWPFINPFNIFHFIFEWYFSMITFMRITFRPHNQVYKQSHQYHNKKHESIAHKASAFIYQYESITCRPIDIWWKWYKYCKQTLNPKPMLYCRCWYCICERHSFLNIYILFKKNWPKKLFTPTFMEHKDVHTAQKWDGVLSMVVLKFLFKVLMFTKTKLF
jgi:hypothetical protein